MASKPYNGHPSWNAWNVSLWISNEEPLYRAALDAIQEAKRVNERRAAKGLSPVTAVKLATRKLLAQLPQRTPDGARYSAHSVRLALAGLE